MEINKEHDQNAYYDPGFYADPALRDYGEATLGQPSVIYRLPIHIGSSTTSTQTMDYFGFGAKDGSDGDIRPPDEGISTAGGSGADRLLPIPASSPSYRVAVRYDPAEACDPPEPVTDLEVTHVDYNTVTISFSPPPNQDLAFSFETRYLEGEDTMLNETEFNLGIPGPVTSNEVPGTAVELQVGPMRPETTYSIAVRTFNRCNQGSRLVSTNVRTTRRLFASVDACFIATAAYGSKDAKDVTLLRHFRDEVLMTDPKGRKSVALYYRLSPRLARIIGSHAFLRDMVRSMLHPIVAIVRILKP